MSSRTRPLALSKSIPMETQNKCPSCGTKLEAVASLVSCGKKQEIRVGVCVYCGYVGYIDRPQEKWIVDFYAKDWDQEFIKSEGHMRSDVILPQGIGPKGSRHAAFGVYKELDVDKNLPFLEIGSGYGQVMENFKLAGFQKLFGVENSRHRAGLVNKVFGFEIVVGVFGSEEVQKKLKEKGPFGLLFSHHVF